MGMNDDVADGLPQDRRREKKKHIFPTVIFANTLFQGFSAHDIA